jgi:hypothetical protein
MRFIEYLIPFSVVSLAVAIRPLKPPRYIAPLLLFSVSLYALAFGLGPIQALFSSDLRPDFVSVETTRIMREKIPDGSQVFTCGWDYTGGLMLALPNRNFIVAADPTLFYLNDPVRYDLWSRISDLQPSVMTSTIRDTFGSTFVICENSLVHARLFDTLSTEPTVSMVLTDDQWVVFEIGKAVAK